MRKNVKSTLLHSVCNVHELSKGCKLEPKFFKIMNNDLTELSAYFQVSKRQAFLLANILSFSFSHSVANFSEFGKHFECNSMLMLDFEKDFQLLCEKKIIRKWADSMDGWTIQEEQYALNDEVKNAIIKNLPMPKHLYFDEPTQVGVLEKICKYTRMRKYEEQSMWRLLSRFKETIDSYSKYPLIKRIQKLDLEPIDKLLFVNLAWKTICSNDILILKEFTENAIDSDYSRIEYIQGFAKNENTLLKEGYVFIEGDRFFDDSALRFTHSSIDLLIDSGIHIYSKEKKKDNIIEPHQISEKKLYYKPDEEKQLGMIKEVLDEKRLQNVQARLSQKSMPTGITALLYGLPGTGKTESVYQIAKQCGREIIHVDLSKTTSMWFGESEKLVKKIFSDYRQYYQEYKKFPILLINEADALFMTRKPMGFSNTTEVINRMQNVLLEEMENFQGILFATTNFAHNFDSAFERRFLFKVEFQKPGLQQKMKIWKLKIKSLSEIQCRELANRYDFSGGQIDNIARKFQMIDVLHGKKASVSEIIAFCEQEVLSKNFGNKIGFSKN